MRPSVVCGLLLLVSLAGCAESGGQAGERDDTFDDVDVRVDDATGAILGVVVDEAIVPVEGATVTVQGDGRSTETDAQGRFVFDRVPAGTHFLEVRKLNYETAQSSVEVEAGVDQPPVLKVQVSRLFTGQPYMQGVQFQGFIACAYQAGITAPCVTDYTQVVPGCGSGCVPILRTIMGDARDTMVEVDAGWQTHIAEVVWEPSAQGTSNALGLIYRDFPVGGANHQYGAVSGPSPLHLRFEVGVKHATQSGPASEMIPPEGYDEIIAFVGTRSDGEPVALTLQQEFEMFLHTFYHGKPPEDWAFLAGDGNPF